MNKELLYQGKKIFYRVIGDGKPVLLVHGFGEDGNIWRNQAPSNSPEGGGSASSLVNQFKFIIPDLPGSGRSEMIDDMSMEGLAEVIRVIMDAETKNPPCLPDRQASGGRGAVIGHSMGGYITLALVEKYPEAVSAFGLFHSSAFADSEEKKATRRKGIEFIEQHGAFEFLKTSTPNLFSQQTKDKQPELIDEMIAASDNFLPRALVSYYDAMMDRPDRTMVLRNATVPVLFIMGKYDVAVPVEDGLKQCHLPGKSYIHVLQSSGHMGMLEEPVRTNLFLDKFLLEI